MNVTQVFGQVTIGYFSDHVNFHILLVGSSICSAIVAFLHWGFSNSFSTLLAFSILYGLVAGGYSVLYCRFVTALTDDPIGLFVYSVFEFERGLGSILAGPVSTSLVLKSIDAHAYGIAKYRYLIIFASATFLVSSIGSLSYFFEDMCFQFVYIYKKYIRPQFADSQSD
jgi:sugar phosphate permease